MSKFESNSSRSMLAAVVLNACAYREVPCGIEDDMAEEASLWDADHVAEIQSAEEELLAQTN